jgi:hypothetical protein
LKENEIRITKEIPSRKEKKEGKMNNNRIMEQKEIVKQKTKLTKMY